MSQTQPAYRATVYSDEAMSTVLTPAVGAAHSDNFQVTTLAGVLGWQPYLDLPQGRRGEFDPRSRRFTTGRLDLTVLDKRTGTGNAQRWVTAFVGNADGQPQLGGLLCYVEESLDGGSTWSSFFTGRIEQPTLSGRTKIRITLHDLSSDLDDEVFHDPPQVDYAFAPPLWPLGLTDNWGPAVAAKTAAGVFHTSNNLVTIAAAEGNDADPQLIVTKELHDLLQSAPVQSSNGDDVHPSIRVHVVNSTASVEGDFYLAAWAGDSGLEFVRQFSGWSIYAWWSQFDAGDHNSKMALIYLGLAELDASDPDHVAMPSDGDNLKLYFKRAGDATKDNPIFVDDVHPVQLWQDILDGKYNRTNTSGTPVKTYPYDSATFTALIADDTIGTFRGVIEKPQAINSFVEKHICLPYSLGYRIDEDGQVVPFDLRRPESTSGAVTITSDDVYADGQAPTWQHDRSKAITLVDIIYYVDQLLKPADIAQDSETFPAEPASLVKTVKVPYRVLDIGDPSLGVKKFEIDATGFHAFLTDDAKENLQRLDWIRRRLLQTAEYLRVPFGRGPRFMTLQLQRNATTNMIQTGVKVVVGVDELPDPATLERGGGRLTYCLSREERGLRVYVQLMDLTDASTATAPTVGAPSAAAGTDGRYRVDVPVTLNASSDPAVVQFALTDTATGAAPAASSTAWTHDVRIISSETVTISRLPPGMRVWVRARSEPEGELPSSWAAGSSYADTTATGTVSGISVSTSGDQAVATWTVSDSTLPVHMVLTNTTIGEEVYDLILKAGTEQRTYTGLVSGDAYRIDISLVDATGEGAVASKAFNASGTATTLSSLVGMGILQGWPGQPEPELPRSSGGLVEIVDTGVILYFVPRSATLGIRLERAPDDGTGSPDTGAITSYDLSAGTRIYVDNLAEGSGPWYYRAAHIRAEATTSSYTDWHEAEPTILTRPYGDIPSEPRLEVDLALDESTGDVSLAINGATYLQSVKWASSTSAYPSTTTTESGSDVALDTSGDATVNGAFTITPGQTGYVTVLGYRTDDGSGSFVVKIQVSIARTGSGTVAAANPTPTATIDQTADTSLSETFTISGSIGAGGSAVGNLQGRWRKRVGHASWGAWSSWTALDVSTGAITADYFYPTDVEAQVRDTGVSGNPMSASVYATVAALLQGIDVGTGRVKFTEPWAGQARSPSDTDVDAQSGAQADNDLDSINGLDRANLRLTGVWDGNQAALIPGYHLFDFTHYDADTIAEGASSKFASESGADITGDHGPDIGHYQNLLGPDASDEHTGTTTPYIYGDGNMSLSSLGLEVGDIISGAFDIVVDNDGTSQTARLRIVFYDSGLSQVGSYQESTYFLKNSSGTAKVENLTIPATTVYIEYSMRRSGDSTWHVTHARLNRGPKALPYANPYPRFLDPNKTKTDDGSTNTAAVGGTVASTSTPSGAYPELTMWAVI